MSFGRNASVATAQDEAYIAILHAIRSGRFQPGVRLIPETIAQELAMSRMPVREAFQRLANEGLVVIRPNRGCVVSGLTIDEIFETFEMRSVLEGLAVRLAMPRVDAGVLAELDMFLLRMERSGEAGGGDWLAHHQAFHEYICGLSGRPKLVKQISALHIAIEPYMRVWLHHVDRPLTATKTQHVVVEAMRTGDAALAEITMRDHVMRTAPRLAEFLRAGNLLNGTPRRTGQAAPASLHLP
ncbi:GntR family transcriptional regulator [Bosea lathyri]|uniref:Transcriptional regulator, GntR family n=1 Tax=Bosea lathyri TaxID=1036778 RepID=A0A1H5XHH3_9HYPH|nr:GntR family transcriptional regulator [Bosea lathyri]SEG11201.1 transcriptional regulator, GntR family [Bosea lathyri]